MTWVDTVRQRLLDLAGSPAPCFGANTHQFKLRPPLSVASLDAIDPQRLFPPDYREFLLGVAVSGAGPGYGLLPPVNVCGWQHEFHAAHDWVPDLKDAAEMSMVEGLGGGYYSDFWLRGCLPLVDWGCGIVSLLLVNAPPPVRGAVFIDVRWAGLGLRQTHASFAEFYASWLDSVDGPAASKLASASRGVCVPIPSGTCANWNALDNFIAGEAAARGSDAATLDDETLAEVLNQIPDAGIAQAVDEDSAYYLAGDRLRACPGCSARVSDYVERGLMRWSQLAAGADLRSLRELSDVPAGQLGDVR